MLDEYEGAVEEQLERAMILGAVEVEKFAKRRCPVETGNLRASITHEVERTSSGFTSRTGTNVKYAVYVEFGTGPRLAQLLGWRPGRPVITDWPAKSADRGGVTGGGHSETMPWLRPAFQDALPLITELLQKAGAIKSGRRAAR